MNKKQLSPEELSKRRALNKKILTFGCLPVFLLFLLMTFLMVMTSEPKKQEPKDLSTMAYVISQSYVKDNLKYPLEADFNLLPLATQNLGNNTYMVQGQVKTKNGFGVQIERFYDATLQYKGGEPAIASSWRLMTLEFSD